jgi:hypothetical protein
MRSISSNDERPPIHLLRILPEDEMQSQLVECDAITSQQAICFDSQ